MASIKSKLVGLNLGIATINTVVLGVFLWLVADLGEDVDRTRDTLPRVEAALASLDDQLMEVSLRFWRISSATDGHSLRLRAEEAEATVQTLREGVAVLRAELPKVQTEGLRENGVLLADGVSLLTQARRDLLNAHRIRGESVPLFNDLLERVAPRAQAMAFIAELNEIMTGGERDHVDELRALCPQLTGGEGSPPCRLLDEILGDHPHPKAAEATQRRIMASLEDRMRAFREALDTPREAVEGLRQEAMGHWSNRLTLLTTTMTLALVLAMPLFFLSQWVQEVHIVRRIDGMRRSTAEWLKGRAPAIRAKGEDELDQMESYLDRFKETIERRDSVLKSTTERLDRARENLRTLLATAPTGIMLADLSSRKVLETNVTAERLLGLDKVDAPLDDVLETLLTRDPWSEILARVAVGDRVENAEITLPEGPPGAPAPSPTNGVGTWLLVSARAVTFDGEPRVLIGLANISRQKVLEAELRERAIRDPLTGLFNRRHFEALALQALKRSRRGGEPVCLVMLDIDHFKAINDTHGHVNGDRALRRLAEILRESLREADTPGRLGGEEFGILLPGVDLEGAQISAERLLRKLREATVRLPHDQTLSMTVSMGIAQIRADDSLESVTNRADMALYAAKEGGRDRVHLEAPPPADGPADPPPNTPEDTP